MLEYFDRHLIHTIAILPSTDVCSIKVTTIAILPSTDVCSIKVR